MMYVNVPSIEDNFTIFVPVHFFTQEIRIGRHVHER
jgi:hypothetical protein